MFLIKNYDNIIQQVGELLERTENDGRGKDLPTDTVSTLTEADSVYVKVDTVETTPAVAPELVKSSIYVHLSVGRRSYYYTVSGVRVSEGSDSIVYELSDDYGHLYTSEDGTFKKVLANETGIYRVTAKDNKTGLVSESHEISGINIQTEIENKLTASELTDFLRTGDYDREDIKSRLTETLSKSVKIACTDDDYKANTIQEVFMSVNLESWKVTVTSLEYDYLGKVIVINISTER